MAVKKLSSVILMLLLNSEGARAALEMNSAKVLRIDLEKHFVPHQEIEELEEYEEADQITIEEDLSYAQLRDI